MRTYLTYMSFKRVKKGQEDKQELSPMSEELENNTEMK